MNDNSKRQSGSNGMGNLSFFENPENRTVKYPQAAELLGCSERHIKRLVKSGSLEIVRLGKVRGVRIYIRSLEAYMAERTGLKYVS